MRHQYSELLRKVNEALELDDCEVLKDLIAEAFADYQSGRLDRCSLEHLRFLAEQYV